MAGSKSDAWELEVLKMVTGQVTTFPTTNPSTTPMVPYVALYTTMTGTDAGTFTEVPSTFGYARVAANGKWGTPAAGQVQNNATVTFPTASGGAWGTIVGFAIHDAASAGHMLMWGTLTANKTVNDGDTASFAATALTLTED